jgi:hypothetical protein
MPTFVTTHQSQTRCMQRIRYYENPTIRSRVTNSLKVRTVVRGTASPCEIKNMVARRARLDQLPTKESRSELDRVYLF